MFRNSNVVVTGGHFTNIDNTGIHDAVSTTLWQHAASGAIFDSAERYALGKCHPGTREKMIERIMNWNNDPSSTQHIIWLHGPAGSGKSALAHSICGLLQQTHPEMYGGSFFFAKGQTDRGKGLKLFPTLSYQLAVQFPSMRSEINTALYRDPSLPTKSMEVQLFALIIQPFLRCRAMLSHSPTLIIDGLDECANDQGMDMQSNIIALISQSIIKYNVPLKFIIASRPESWIRDAFEALPLPDITLSLSLREDIDADKDIKAYLTDEFEKIRVENKRIMESVPTPWPPTNIIDRFVYEASGQYIYAATVLKFVGKSSRFNDPQEQLRILTSPGPHRASAFSELDRLYETIIAAYPRWASMKRVLGGIISNANATVIEIVLGVDPTEVVLVLDALSPLIDVKWPRSPTEHELLLEPIFGSLIAGQETINFSHLSFREFLEDETRSGPFHIDVRDIRDEIHRAFFGIIHRNLDQNYGTEPNLSLNIGLATYQGIMSAMTSTFIRCSDIDTMRLRFITITDRLLHLEPDIEMEYFGCFMADMDWLDVMASEVSRAFTMPAPPLAPPTNQHFDEEKVHDLLDAVRELQDVASFARQRRIHLLSSCNRFRVTPTLAYMNEFHKVWCTTIGEMFADPMLTVDDVLSTFQQHRNIINIFYSNTHRVWFLGIANLNDDLANDDLFGDHVDEGWRTRGEWRHQRLSFVSQYLTTTLNKGYDDESPYHYLGKCFMSHNLSDVHSKKYFQNPCNLSILALITDFSAWAGLVAPLQPEHWLDIGYLVTGVLCWLSRQLTNPNTLRLLDNHDKDLVSRMRTAIKQLFEHHFLPNFKGPYYSQLYISTSHSGTEARSMRIKLFPLPQNCYQEEEIAYISHEEIYFDYWRPFHDEVFGKTPRTQRQDIIPSTIDQKLRRAGLPGRQRPTTSKH